MHKKMHFHDVKTGILGFSVYIIVVLNFNNF